MDGLLNKVDNSGLGCHMGGMFPGAFGYADDVKLLTSNVWVLHQMACICKKYAQKFDGLFNSKKSQVIIYKAYNVKPTGPCVTINDARVNCVDKVIHLGHSLTENMYEFNMSKFIDDFNH